MKTKNKTKESTKVTSQSPILAFEEAAWRREFRAKLLRWYRREKRDLPWRQQSDPYAVWVSEIMLQQTQVVTVQKYFSRFQQRFPTVTDLAAAPESEVLRLWEGLGYYRRARQMHAAAKQIVDQHEGKFPVQFDDVLALPGIGRYTAGAILSIALDQRHPILEANTVRLFARLTAYRDDPLKAEGQRLLWQIAAALLPRTRCGEFNQALMELGSLVCAPRCPACESCPVGSLCPTNQGGWQSDIPASKKKVVYEEVTEVAVVIRRGQRVVLRECEPGERWAGLWDFPRFAVKHGTQPLADGKGGKADRQSELDLVQQVEQQFGLRVTLQDRLATIKHGVTKYRITLHCVTASPEAGGRLKKPARWIPLQEIGPLPLSVTGRKIGHLLSTDAS
jgi:A/G-specific adenine glycosylase